MKLAYMKNRAVLFSAAIASSMLILSGGVSAAEKTETKPSSAVSITASAEETSALPDGEYELGEGGLRIRVAEGMARLADSQTLAGSVATMDLVVRTVWRLTGLPLAQIVKSATETPARIMGVDGSKGSLREGFDADIVIFDNDVNVSEVIVGGKLIC